MLLAALWLCTLRKGPLQTGIVTIPETCPVYPRQIILMGNIQTRIHSLARPISLRSTFFLQITSCMPTPSGSHVREEKSQFSLCAVGFVRTHSSG